MDAAAMLILWTPREPASMGYKSHPRPSNSTISLSLSLTDPPVAATRPEEVVFSDSGNYYRRQYSDGSDAVWPSLSQVSPPLASLSTHRSIPALDFAREPP